MYYFKKKYIYIYNFPKNCPRQVPLTERKIQLIYAVLFCLLSPRYDKTEVSVSLEMTHQGNCSFTAKWLRPGPRVDQTQGSPF